MKEYPKMEFFYMPPICSTFMDNGGGEMGTAEGSRMESDKDKYQRTMIQNMAILSLIFGVTSIFMTLMGVFCSLFCFIGLFLGVPGIFLGFMGLKRSVKVNDVNSKIMSIIGIISSAISITFSMMMMLLILLYMLLNIALIPFLY